MECDGRRLWPRYAVPMQDPRPMRLYWEDFPVGHEHRFGAMPVTREAVLAFAGQFDPQPFHLDDEAARDSLFGGLCASGWHTASMAMRMMCDEYLQRTASLGSPGVEQLRWARPVYPGDTLHMTLRVTESRRMASRPGVGLAKMLWTVGNQHGQTVMTVEAWNMLQLRPAG